MNISPSFERVKLIKSLNAFSPGLMILTVLFLFTFPLKVFAEGSVDLIKYPGYRMFLDTRDTQQFKVYAKSGEFINLGASHLGLSGGFIRVFRPNGSIAATFDNTGPNTGKGIINNNIEELSGPTGGGTTNGTGYIPATIQVGAGEEGVWTVVFGFPSYVNASFINILNNLPWTRGFNQPSSPRVVLAWDVTVTTGAAGNMGGAMQKGRLFTQEFITLINGNGVETSPSLFVQTPDGYLYRIDIDKADPFRFPISSNSRGLVDGKRRPIYKSLSEDDFNRSSTPSTWHPDSIYLYEPQARDNGSLINNKIFFNPPDPSMPANAPVFDLKSMGTFTTWLYRPLEILVLLDFKFVGVDPGGIGCTPWSMEHLNGGYFYIKTTVPGFATFYLDLNNNGKFDDPVDIKVSADVNEGLDSIFWNGKDGLGVPLPLNDSLKINYKGNIKFGELHIAMTDVENLNGGVNFKWVNAPGGFPDSLFYFDHSKIGGPVSGGGTPGNALPTSTSFKYSNEFGNDKYIDQWFFIELNIDPTPATLAIVEDCPCSLASPVGNASAAAAEVCAGNEIVLSATNSKSGLSSLTYKWTGPGLNITQTHGPGDTSRVRIPNSTAANSGIYLVTIETNQGCIFTSPPITVTVNPKPVASPIVGGGSFCSGAEVTLSSSNTVAGIPTINYSWSGPNGFSATGSTTGTGNISVTLPSIQAAGQGTYTLNMSSDKGCTATAVNSSVIVRPQPSVSAVSAGGTFCERDNVLLSAVNSTPGISSITYNWSGPGGYTSTQTLSGGDTSKITLTIITAAQGGVYSLVGTADGCATPTLNFTVNVNDAPVISALSPDSTFCSGSAVILSASNSKAGVGTLKYTWSGPNLLSSGTGPEAGPFTANIPAIGAANAGTYTLELETANGCKSVTRTVNIGVSATPAIANLTGGGDYCVGQTITLSATNSASGTGNINFIWAGPNGVVASGTAPQAGPFTATIANAAANHSGTYTLTLTSVGGKCSAPAQSVNVNVLTGLTITNLTTDKDYCEGTNVVLTASNTIPAGNVTYTWTGPNGFTFTKTVAGNAPFDLTIPDIKPIDAGDYVLNLMTASGCNFGPATVKVGVTRGFYVTNINPVGTVCEGTNVVLTASGKGSATSGTYSWTGPCGFSAVGTITNPSTPFSSNVNLIGANCGGQYTLTVTAPGGCVSAPASINVVVAPKPVLSDITGGGTYCQGQTANLTFKNNLNQDSVKYTYTINGVATSGVVRGSNTVTVPVTQTTAFTATLESFIGCKTEVKNAQVTFLPTAKPTATATAQICQGAALNLTATNSEPGSGTVSYTWTGPGGYSFSGTAPWAGPFPATVASPQSGDYCLQVSSSNGLCISSSVCTKVTVNPKPSITGVQGGGAICSGTNTTITFTVNPNGAPNVTYNIKGPGLDSTRNVTTQTTVTINVRVGPTTAGVYNITVQSNAGCNADPASVTITSKAITQAVLTPSSTTICQGTTLTLTTNAQTGPNISYEWYKDGTRIGTTTTATFNVANATAGKYSVVAFADGCSSTSAEATVSLIPAPVAGGDSFEGEVGVPLNGNLAANDNSGGRPVTYTVVTPPANGTVSISANGTMTYTPKLGFAGNDQFTYRICLTECPALCANATVQIKIVQKDCIVPNVITPNGDGVNDLLIILCLVNNAYPNNIFRVFNRWGDEVFTAEPYTNNWDGTHGKDKKDLPAGTYYYLLKLDKNSNDTKTGYIRIVR